METQDNNQLYYYFKIRDGQPYDIKVTPVHINTNINVIYSELTDEQREFFISNPSATALEIWDCKLSLPYVPSDTNVFDFAEKKVKMLKNSCYDSITITPFEYAVAIEAVINSPEDDDYSVADAKSLLASFREQSHKKLEIVNMYIPRIMAAKTIDEVNELYEKALKML